jgi:alkylation response protein AidB-like acyl-CoA dehydrogenase
MTPEQDELRAAVRDFFQHHGADWKRLTGELGLTALPIDEAHGGFGATPIEVGIALEEAGAVLLDAPLLPTLVAGMALHGASTDVLPALAAGTAIGTVAGGDCTARPSGAGFVLDGVDDHVLDGHRADLVLVAAASGLYLVRTEHATLEAHPTLDQTRGQARLVLDSTPAERVGGPEEATRALDLLYAALAIEAIGVARASLALTVAHLKTREQFGVPLATFQALRHRVADLHVQLEAATSSAWHALHAAGTAEFTIAAPLAKLVAAEAAYAITAEGIQLLGGIGFTWEHDAHRYFKRATTTRLLCGDAVALRRLLALRAGLRADPRADLR